MNFINILFLSINSGNPHFISTADVLMRGIFLPVVGILSAISLAITIKQIKQSFKDTEYEDFVDEGSET